MHTDEGTIRLATVEDVAALQRVEVAAGAPFRTIGMDAVADDDPPTTDELAADCRVGRIWVLEMDGEVVGYARASVVDGEAHLAQVSLDPRVARRGLGQRLLAAVMDWARAGGCRALSLTTFTEVPWNGPYYERLGFREVAPATMGPELRAIRAIERAAGLDRWPRIAMRRDLGTGADVP